MAKSNRADETDDSKGTASFSVRFTENQRELLARAAEIRGWTVTNLLKTAALERAAHIINTSAPNRIDFRGVADKVADRVFGERRCRLLAEEGGLVDGYAYESLAEAANEPGAIDGADGLLVEVSPWNMSPEFLDEVKDATRFGGLEFLSLILDSSEGIVTRSQPNLPDPIDPSAV